MSEIWSQKVLQKSCLLVKGRNDVVAHGCVILVVSGEKRECLQKMLPRDEVAGCLSGFLRRSRRKVT